MLEHTACDRCFRQAGDAKTVSVMGVAVQMCKGCRYEWQKWEDFVTYQGRRRSQRSSGDRGGDDPLNPPETLEKGPRKGK